MSASPSIPTALGNELLESLWEDGERVFYRTRHGDRDSGMDARIAVLPAADPPSAGAIDRLVHEFELREHLNSAWALRPLQLVREPNRTMLILESASGALLSGLVGSPMEIGRFLRISIGLAVALRGLHEGGLVHKDIKPSNAVVNDALDLVRFTGFGIASRLARE